jgi:hypothetical protein
MTTPPEPSRVRPFAAVLSELDSGRVHAAASSGLVELVEAVIGQNKKGYMTVRIELKPAGNGVTDSLIVTGQVIVKAPDSDPGTSIFFIDGDGCLIRQNPIQDELPLREVPAPPPAADRPVRHIQES